MSEPAKPWEPRSVPPPDASRVSSSAVATYQGNVRGYVDLHAHVLPGIDDGPADTDGALDMLRAAAAAGIGTIAVTPHLRSDFPDVRVTELDPALSSFVRPARWPESTSASSREPRSRWSWALEASDEQLALATYDQGGTDLLIETPTFNVIGLESLLYRLRAKGLRVTLAHPERSVEFQRDPARLVDLVRQGVLLQVNADALLTGRRRSAAHRLGTLPVLEGLAHALASDGHRASAWRPVTCLADAVGVAATLIGPDRTRWMTQTAPAAIIAGADLPDAPTLRIAEGCTSLLDDGEERSVPDTFGGVVLLVSIEGRATLPVSAALERRHGRKLWSPHRLCGAALAGTGGPTGAPITARSDLPLLRRRRLTPTREQMLCDHSRQLTEYNAAGLKVMYVLGAPPNFVKMAPAISEVRRALPDGQHVVVHTGQHYDRMMSSAFIDELRVPSRTTSFKSGRRRMPYRPPG